MQTRRLSLCALAGSALVLTTACQEAAAPGPALIAADVPMASAAKDRQAPTAPSNLRATTTWSTVSLTWNAAVDNVGVAAYVVRSHFGGEIRVAGNTTSVEWTGLSPLQTYSFYVYAVDAAGNKSTISNYLSVKTPSQPAPDDPSDVTPPTIPGNVMAFLYDDGSRELQVMWSASTDNVTPPSSIRYEVFVNGVHDNSSIGVTQTSIYGVAGENVITVVAIDARGNRSSAGAVTLNLP